jgi:hypothetical protein
VTTIGAFVHHLDEVLTASTWQDDLQTGETAVGFLESSHENAPENAQTLPLSPQAFSRR